MNTNLPQTSDTEPRTSLLIELHGDRPGALEAALKPFGRHGVSLTHIESRPRRGQTFDFYVDCDGESGECAMEAVIAELRQAAVGVVVLDHKDVPWFPRHAAELDRIANRTLDAGDALQADHPGFADPAYRARRAMVDALARSHRHGSEFPVVEYTPTENATWREVYERLDALRRRHACREYRRAFADFERHCGFEKDRIPQGRDVSAFLESRTGFRLRPVAGLLSPRDFLNGLAFRVFFSTQYIRHESKPFYTPEPDVCHELLGHAPMFADPAFADLSQEIGLASLGASDEDIERLARCYWHSVEFGLLLEGGDRKAYGAGLLSSYGELDHACANDSSAEFVDWNPAVAAKQRYPVTEYQPVYFVAESLPDAKTRMRAFCEALPRQFYARYNPATDSIWVDRAVRRTD
ncbi:MAG: ACT domain-containing protein [Gammaproteobacteria bacterium]|nr:ACT domain-containing protein [Gammaproteobacteria bacterium]